MVPLHVDWQLISTLTITKSGVLVCESPYSKVRCCFFQVQYILDEIVMGGMVLETNITLVLKAIREMEKHQATQSPQSQKSKKGVRVGGRRRYI